MMAWLLGAFGAVFGWSAMPWLGDRILRRAYRRANSWWWGSLEAYRAFKQAHPCEEPASSDPGLVGAIGIWRNEAAAAVVSKTMTVERLEALQDVGFKIVDSESTCTDSDQQRRCSFEARLWHRMLLALVTGAGVLLAFWSTTSVIAGCALCSCIFAMIVSVVCDLRARIIPLETCAVLVLAGIVFQASTRGLEGVLVGGGGALVIVAGSMAANRAMRIRCPSGAIGRGDMRCMIGLSLATGLGMPWGFAACYVLAAAWAGLGCILRRISWGDGIPMAPFLSVWLVCGVASCLASL